MWYVAWVQHYRWRAARCRSLCRALGQGEGGARGGGGRRSAAKEGRRNKGERDRLRRDGQGLMRTWVRFVVDLEHLIYSSTTGVFMP